MKYVCQKWGQRVGTPTYVTILQPTDTFPLPLLPLTSNLLVAVPFPPLPSPPPSAETEAREHPACSSAGHFD